MRDNLRGVSKIRKQKFAHKNGTPVLDEMRGVRGNENEPAFEMGSINDMD